MSETEFHKGKMRKIELPEGLTIEKQIEKLNDLGHYLDSSHYEIENNKLAYFNSKRSKLFYYKNEWYYIYEKSSLEPNEDIFEAKKRGRCIEYTLKYHNGGCGFEEAMEEAFDKMLSNKK